MRFQSNPLVANPALKPERTVDYALGFQQVLSKTSSLKIEAFYRELRNMIQMRKFVGAYPIAYRAFDNIDFGTVKGLTLTYDLRSTGNIRMNASYTLQFADGTGSTSQSQAALDQCGSSKLEKYQSIRLRSTSPFHPDH
jgi:outer membrane cobalamin receptor